MIDVALVLLRLLLVGVLFFHSSTCINALPSSASRLSSPKHQIGRALVDYSAATTEYAHSHYNIPFYLGLETVREEALMLG
jgi:biopolymer transport protein ExbD